MSHAHDAFDYIALALTLTVPVGLFALSQLMVSFRNLRTRIDDAQDKLLSRIEELERWRSAQTGRA